MKLSKVNSTARLGMRTGEVKVDSIFADDTPDTGYTPVIDTSKYRIVFEANDGSTANTTQSVDYNTTSLLIANQFTYQGYAFKEWNTKKDGSGTSYPDKAILAVGSKQSYGDNTTLNLYAQWISEVDCDRMGNRSTDLYTRVVIGNFTSAGNLKAETELVGIVLESASGSVGSLNKPGITDQIAFNLYDTLEDNY